MAWNWFYGLIYGLLGGFCELLPVSSQAHGILLEKLAGLPQSNGLLNMSVHLGALVALLFMYRATISKLRREQRIASLAPRRRKRQPDTESLMTLSLLKVAAWPLVFGSLLTLVLTPWFTRLWVLGLLVILHGILVFIPQYRPQGNKEIRSTSPLDALLMGLSGIVGLLPGFSRVGVVSSIGSLRGMSKQFCLQFTYLLSIPALAALCVTDVISLFFSGGQGVSGAMFLPCIFALLAAFGTALAGIRLMQFLAVKIGFESFAYYNWGFAMFTFIIYLIG